MLHFQITVTLSIINVKLSPTPLNRNMLYYISLRHILQTDLSDSGGVSPGSRADRNRRGWTPGPGTQRRGRMGWAGRGPPAGSPLCCPRPPPPGTPPYTGTGPRGQSPRMRSGGQGRTHPRRGHGICPCKNIFVCKSTPIIRMLVSPSVTPMQSKDPEEGPRCTQKDPEYIILYFKSIDWNPQILDRHAKIHNDSHSLILYCSDWRDPEGETCLTI